MTLDDLVLAEIYAAFGNVERPEHFTIEDGDPECMEHDALLRSMTPETLTAENAGGIGYHPWTECLPEGLSYFFPALARITLEKPADPYEWFGEILFPPIRRPDFVQLCNLQQRRAVAHFLKHILESRKATATKFLWIDELKQCHELWAAAAAQTD